MNSASKSKWACYFSIQTLFRDCGKRELADPVAPKDCRLWTFTFPDLATRRSAAAASKKFSEFCHCRNMRERLFLHVLEDSKKGFWHIHLVTPEFWRVDEIREHAEPYGFGRINVKRVPLEKAQYIAKYLHKRLGVTGLGVRRWACHGFRGTQSRHVKKTDVLTPIIPDTYHSTVRDEIRWTLGVNFTISVKLREPVNSTPVVQMIELKPTAQKQILSDILNGKLVAVGEYRGFGVRTIKFEDEKSRQQVEKIIVEHSIEFGGISVKCGEWLAPGAKAADVKAPAQKGDIVVCVVTKASQQYGYSCESIKPLATLL